MLSNKKEEHAMTALTEGDSRSITLEKEGPQVQ